ncbi:hypothetical protein TSTA_102890 [Talaromyces stipitatus ATCC 10500]|uniref:Uncharacterized protein n=1 Tax=Talaromyces stipitatus (strain ATCC 10500 / CBS 375.48 / QM 6759 / NRRL 1006) TaxID=441959 RepID=B8MNH3_TALSN|nr:uncharacterized protein TSTA_102890 [Talaromyces stipitatus ATCC 10500]EED14062.1 hypothetical protein TSTA_102890 [Talaromyces stipitatus ATCC 10500]
MANQSAEDEAVRWIPVIVSVPTGLSIIIGTLKWIYKAQHDWAVSIYGLAVDKDKMDPLLPTMSKIIKLGEYEFNSSMFEWMSPVYTEISWVPLYEEVFRELEWNLEIRGHGEQFWEKCPCTYHRFLRFINDAWLHIKNILRRQPSRFPPVIRQALKDAKKDISKHIKEYHNWKLEQKPRREFLVEEWRQNEWLQGGLAQSEISQSELPQGEFEEDEWPRTRWLSVNWKGAPISWRPNNWSQSKELNYRHFHYPRILQNCVLRLDGPRCWEPFRPERLFKTHVQDLDLQTIVICDGVPAIPISSKELGSL